MSSFNPLIVVSGHLFLGAFIGDTDNTSQYVQSKGISYIIKLSKAVEQYPQAAFSAKCLNP